MKKCYYIRRTVKPNTDILNWFIRINDNIYFLLFKQHNVNDGEYVHYDIA